jgi:hypothetical protein
VNHKDMASSCAKESKTSARREEASRRAGD